MNTNKIEIYTDGSAPNNQKLQPNSPTAWAYVIKGLSPQNIENYKAYTGRTNNDMELSAFIAALNYLTKKYPVTLSGYDIDVFSDSDYLVNGYNVYLTNWVTNQWRKYDNTPLKNLDKWQEIYRLKSVFSASQLSLTHVKAHTNNAGNNRADELAHKAINQLIASRNHNPLGPDNGNHP